MANGITAQQLDNGVLNNYITSLKFDGDDTIYHVGMTNEDYNKVVDVLESEGKAGVFDGTNWVDDDGNIITDAEGGRLLAEQKRQMAEQERITAEGELGVFDVNSNEWVGGSGRLLEEQKRIQAENIRSEAEGAEGVYDEESNTWIEEGSGRLFTEQIREINEDKRIAAESERYADFKNISVKIETEIDNEDVPRYSLVVKGTKAEAGDPQDGNGYYKNSIDVTTMLGNVTSDITANVRNNVEEMALQKFYTVNCSAGGVIDVSPKWAGQKYLIGNTHTIETSTVEQPIKIDGSFKTSATSGSVYSYTYSRSVVTPTVASGYIKDGSKKIFKIDDGTVSIDDKKIFFMKNEESIEPKTTRQSDGKYYNIEGDKTNGYFIYKYAYTSTKVYAGTACDVYIKKLITTTTARLDDINTLNVLINGKTSNAFSIRNDVLQEVYDNIVAIKCNPLAAPQNLTYGTPTAMNTIVQTNSASIGLASDGTNGYIACNKGVINSPTLIQIYYNKSKDGYYLKMVTESYEYKGDNVKIYSDSKFKNEPTFKNYYGGTKVYKNYSTLSDRITGYKNIKNDGANAQTAANEYVSLNPPSDVNYYGQLSNGNEVRVDSIFYNEYINSTTPYTDTKIAEAIDRLN